MRYRTVQGVRAVPFFATQACWNHLRRGLRPQPSDVWITGYPSSGNLLVQFLVRTLLHGGDANAVLAAPYASGVTSPLEIDVSRGKIDLPQLEALPAESRIFTCFHAPSHLPSAAFASSHDGGGASLPAGVRAIHPIRDPRDACVSLFSQSLNLAKCDWPAWVDAYVDGARMPWAGWLEQNKAWWDAHVANPEQVLWITFEEMVGNPDAAVRRVAAFLGLQVRRFIAAHVAAVVGPRQPPPSPSLAMLCARMAHSWPPTLDRSRRRSLLAPCAPSPCRR